MSPAIPQPGIELGPLITPKALRRDSRIAIVSPAGIARCGDVESGAAVLARHGWRPEIAPHALGRCGSYSGTPDERLADLSAALLDPGIDAIICTRGGYGAVHLLDRLDRLPLRRNPKWLVGFSDICALHGLMMRHGIACIHGPMMKHISACGGNNPDFAALCTILEGGGVDYIFPPHPYNRTGSASGPMAGGNMAVGQGLLSTPYTTIREGSVLLIEDIGEPIYKVERMLHQLRLGGILEGLRALLVGKFVNYTPDANHAEMEDMIRHLTAPYSYPVAFGVPIGHGGNARPLIFGAEARISVSAEGVSLRQ